MKKLIFLSFVLSLACTAASGQVEKVVYTDADTQNEVWQLTDGKMPSDLPYFYCQPFTGDDKYLVFYSNRDGEWKLYRSELATGIVTKLSDRATGNKFTMLPPEYREVVYMADGVYYAIDVATARERVVVDLNGKLGEDTHPGPAGSFTNDGKYLIFMAQDAGQGKGMALYRIYLPTLKIEKVYDAPFRFTHPLINPENPDLISFVPPDSQNDTLLSLDERARVWLVTVGRDGGSTARPWLVCPPGFRATHESWSRDGKELFFFYKDLARGGTTSVASMKATDPVLDSGTMTLYHSRTTMKYGHGGTTTDGKWFVSDSQTAKTNPLYLIDLRAKTETIVCMVNSSMSDASFHPHPMVSQSGKYAAFNSDRNTIGTPQVFVVPIGKFTERQNY